MIEKITSLQNPKVKDLIRLQTKSSERRKQNSFIIEGFREVSRAIKSGILFREIYICPDYMVLDQLTLLKNMAGEEVAFIEISAVVFQRLAYRDSSDGVIGLAIPRFLPLNQVKPGDLPLVLVVESIEKPGNLGALLRTADAAKVDAVIICDPHTDLYNPNVIRNSLGGLFSNRVIICSADETLQWLKRYNIRILAAALTPQAVPYTQVAMNIPVAIIMGSEANGLSNFWLTNADTHVVIPMLGIVDSLNVSTSAAILLYEAIRQRN